MFIDNYHETGFEPTEVPFKLDRDSLNYYDLADSLILCTVRFQGRIVGYGAFITMPHTLHTELKHALSYAFYLMPLHRKGNLASKFLAYCEATLKEANVAVVYMNMHDKATHFMQRNGYAPHERVFGKRL